MQRYAILAMLPALVLEARQITPRDQTRLQNALAAYNAGNAQEAEVGLQDLAKRYPDKFEVIETLGLIYAERGEIERALPLLEAAYIANKSSPEAAANLGVAYLQLKHGGEAVTTLAHAVSLDPGNSQTQTSYGRALMMAKRPQEAAKAFAVACALDPANADILYDWALAEFDSREARQASALLARIPPQFRSAQVESLCGDAEETQGHFDQALTCFQNAAKLEESEANLNAVGLELLKHWSFDAAIKIYEYGLSKYPSSERLQTGLGIGLYGSGQYDKAAEIFSKLLVSFPNQAAYAKFLGQSCVAIKAESHEYCGELVTYTWHHPADSLAATLAAASILEQHESGEFPLARQLLQRAIAKEPESAEAYYRMGVLEQEEGKWIDSVTMLKRADALRPGSSRTHLHLAVAYFHLGQKQQAHHEAELQKQSRESEKTEVEDRQKDVKMFLLDMR